MESININNYEAYFLDFLEGTLSAEDEAAMYLFLDAQPQLKSEFSDLTGVSLDDVTLEAAETPSFSTASLKADPSVLSAMTVEQWMVSSVENQLTDAQNAQLLQYIAKHKLETKFVAYQATILAPQAADVFGNKSGLKRKPATVIPMWMKYSSAAAAVALLVFFVNPFSGENEVAEENPVGIVAPEYINFKNFQAGLPRAIKVNSIESDNKPQTFDQEPINNFVVEENNEKIDSSKLIVPNIEAPDDIVEEKLIDTAKTIIEKPVPEFEDDQIAVIEKPDVNNTVEEEPYSIITNAASNVTNRKISFTRTYNADSQEYVAYNFKIGKFEFDRKKRSK